MYHAKGNGSLKVSLNMALNFNFIMKYTKEIILFLRLINVSISKALLLNNV